MKWGMLCGFGMFALAAGLVSPGTALAQVLVEDQASGPVGQFVTVAHQIPRESVVQSFTPSQPGIGFIQLQTVISPSVPGGGVTVEVQLREGGSLGPIIATTLPLFMQNVGTEFTVFYFGENFPITPEREYFLEPIVLGGGQLGRGAVHRQHHSSQHVHSRRIVRKRGSLRWTG
jgi:hypothetical protein